MAHWEVLTDSGWETLCPEFDQRRELEKLFDQKLEEVLVPSGFYKGCPLTIEYDDQGQVKNARMQNLEKNEKWTVKRTGPASKAGAATAKPGAGAGAAADEKKGGGAGDEKKSAGDEAPKKAAEPR
jgi:hypothetical protein